MNIAYTLNRTREKQRMRRNRAQVPTMDDTRNVTFMALQSYNDAEEKSTFP
jgi:hypothetical protein